MKLKDVWPSWPSGRPLKPFFIMTKGPVNRTIFPKGVIRVRKLPRLSSEAAKPVADTNPANPPPDDRPGLTGYGPDVEREMGRILTEEIGLLLFDAARATYDFGRSAVGRLTESLTAPPPVPVREPPQTPPAPSPVAPAPVQVPPVGTAEIQPSDYAPGGKFRPVVEFRERWP